MENRTYIGAAVLAAILACAGGASFLHKHPNPTLREVYAACEKGEITGTFCCEDFLAEDCAPISPKNPDPTGLRKFHEDEWDAKHAKESK